jgi:large subunit GTPase 1
MKEASWVKMRSVTEQAALDEFLSTAELAGTDFTAEKMNNVKIIHTDQKNPYLLSAQEEKAAVRKQSANKARLTVPRRPAWDETTTPQELDRRERDSLLEWRRGLAELQESNDLLMTPFERNVEVWRQLWRVIERSDLVVQIVDARNPLLFRSEDLERYVKEVDPRKENLLLVNKADMMTREQRLVWAEWFESKDIRYRFFSAFLAKEANEKRDAEEELKKRGDGEAVETNEQRAKRMVREMKQVKLNKEDEDSEEDSEEDEDDEEKDDEEEDTDGESFDEHDAVAEDHEDDEDPRTRILNVDELEAIFLENAPALPETDGLTPQRKIQIGLVGYPNVGKSSTINALIGAKKVSVSSTPGKTKHFQTIHLSADVVLCDCPGLVFPNFATTKAELVCNGILPIDQLREFTGPAGLVARRIPRPFFEAVYGVKVMMRPEEEGGTGIPTAEEILFAYARARGFATTGLGQPDAARAARYILKDYVKGKLLYCHPPPTDPPIDGDDFNRELYDDEHLPTKRRAAALAAAAKIQHDDPLLDDITIADSDLATTLPQGPKSKGLDKKFFGPGQGSKGHLKMPFNHRYTEQGSAVIGPNGKLLSGRKLKAMIALEKDVDVSEVRGVGAKKHFKGGAKRRMLKAPTGQEDF